MLTQTKQRLLSLSLIGLIAFALTLLLAQLLARAPAAAPHTPASGAFAPGAAVAPRNGASASGQAPASGAFAPGASASGATPAVPVYLAKLRSVDRVPLEAYVRGVVAAELPIAFELEAMKAQALAARTYVVRRMSQRDFSGVPVKDAIVTDTVAHQVFWTIDEMKRQWGDQFAANFDKVTKAIQQTEGLILTYEGQPIQATFFSTSNGYTENAADYWGVAQPYLRSVPSPWDRALSPNYRETVTFTLQQFAQKLGLSQTISASTMSTGMRILSTTEGHRIAKIRIGGTTFTAREVREKLGLNSTQFEWRWRGNTIELTTTGYGHGVGLSQWGANGMAKEGKTAEQIVRYYYSGISIENGDSFIR